jgi:hypothetical protein
MTAILEWLEPVASITIGVIGGVPVTVGMIIAGVLVGDLVLRFLHHLRRL